MRRRQFVRAVATLPAVAALPAAAQASQPFRIARVTIEREGTPSPGIDAFRGGLRDLGYIEGKDYLIADWWGNGSGARLEALAPEIVRSNPDVILSQGGVALNPMIRAGVTVPILFTYSGDAVEGKIVESYARPGVNRTGISYFTVDLVGKRLDMLREMLPALKRVAFLANSQHPGERQEFAASQAAAARLGMSARYFAVRSEPELEAALAEIARGRDEAILAFADAFTMSFAERIGTFSIRSRIPAIDGWSQFARAGNLMTYGPVLEDCYRRLAAYVDKLRKGAKASELPVELPTKVELVINARTAKAIGITVPPSLLLRADEVIR